MVEYPINEEQLDQVFHALSDPTRRGMVRMLAQEERTVTELAAPFDMSLAAASKHIKVLEQAGLLQRTVHGRTHTCKLDSRVLARATRYLQFYERFWSAQFDTLEMELNKAKGEEH
ncbi:ArsR/SmtB family transcription factor [Paenibacillus agaridevorans]|jgi:DNA-binding transcriptional ArsR family regulator|uniref:ArsR/SmtB family transcription factor n=1 Tax=Paenibacillus agaridevorans TaxID=171404 RepID=UPI000D59E720|nr:metalloregulator ArsR/SmtB family transcription factor [Paenibacillus agaridevorans]